MAMAGQQQNVKEMVEVTLRVRLEKNEFEVMKDLAKKKGKTADDYASDCVVACIPADVEDTFDKDSKAYRRLMKKIGLGGF